jgi:hypothetical protein
VKPTTKQLAYLRALAHRTGQTFTLPATRADASRDIRRLREATPSSRQELGEERRAIRDALSVGDGARAAVRDEEITGYGSSCEWA